MAWGRSCDPCTEHRKMPSYGEAEYWDQRYQAEPVFFDWYMAYEGLAPVLKQHVPNKEANILQVWCFCQPELRLRKLVWKS